MAKKSTLGRVLTYVGRYPVSLVFSLLFAAVSVGASLLVPIFIGDAVDCILENGVLWEELFAVFVKIGAAVLISAVAQWLTSLCNNVDGFALGTAGSGELGYTLRGGCEGSDGSRTILPGNVRSSRAIAVENNGITRKVYRCSHVCGNRRRGITDNGSRRRIHNERREQSHQHSDGQ